MYGIFTYIWAIFGVNVGKYSIHGASGIYHSYHREKLWSKLCIFKCAVHREKRSLRPIKIENRRSMKKCTKKTAEHALTIPQKLGILHKSMFAFHTTYSQLELKTKRYQKMRSNRSEKWLTSSYTNTRVELLLTSQPFQQELGHFVPPRTFSQRQSTPPPHPQTHKKTVQCSPSLLEL